MNWKFAVGFLIFACMVFGQVDSLALRAKYGAPLNRETFTVRPGVALIVDYSPTTTHACQLEFPGSATPADARPGVGYNPKKLIDDLVAEIVPLSVRGKEVGKMCTASGLAMMCLQQYERVSISEPMRGEQRTAVIVKFKTPDCAQ